jgi:hypothetical protein
MRNGIVCLALLAAPLALPVRAQQVQKPTEQAKAQFFAGIVTEMDTDHLTVSRNVVGRSPERHTFLVNSKTKIGKGLHTSERVTVRYKPSPDGDVALEILVRTRKALRAG